ncbi:P-II family nitrogen regulator [Nocardioides sp.]|uniref:P-II family nitrogen regulator n=1 Tax=Nocardioides sp. TaxID=35761 RepID=UPI003529454C
MERTDMDEIELGALKKLEIVVEGEHREFVTDLLDHAGVKGYTIVENLSGKGAHGFHQGHLMFNDDALLIMIIAAVPEPLVQPILGGFAPFLGRHSGVVFVSDIQVMRMVKFQG